VRVCPQFVRIPSTGDETVAAVLFVKNSGKSLQATSVFET
jgi:hypothetical protein